MSGHEDIPHPSLESGLPQGEKPGGFGRGQPGLESLGGYHSGQISSGLGLSFSSSDENGHRWQELKHRLSLSQG